MRIRVSFFRLLYKTLQFLVPNFFEKKRTAVFNLFLKFKIKPLFLIFFMVQDIPFTLKYNGYFCLDAAMAKLLRSVIRNQL